MTPQIKEWLHTNGLGGYSSSTLCGLNSRRYHGLFVPAVTPPRNRSVLVSKIEEDVILKNQTPIQLGTNQYPNAIYPSGFTYLTGYQLIPFPSFMFSEESVFSISKTIFFNPQTNSLFVEYANLGHEPIDLLVNPLFVSRDINSLFFENSFYDFYLSEKSPKFYELYPHYGAFPIFIKVESTEFIESRNWIKNVELAEEQKRGFDFHEDYYQIGKWKFALAPGEKKHIGFSLNSSIDKEDIELIKVYAEKKYLSGSQPIYSTFYNDLVASSKQFLVESPSAASKSVIAGYHWFADWGRDTMISMRGLTIATGKKDETAGIIKTFFGYLSGGMLPNMLPESPNDVLKYNTADATLWLFIVLYEYHKKFQDLSLVTNYFDKLTEIIEFHLKGTRYNIHVLENGLLYASEDDVQLTWMDAKVGDRVITPRHGCPVEINALWYNALCIYEYFSKFVQKPIETRITHIIQTFPSVFQQYFFNKELRYLNDVIIPDQKIDTSNRPNQIYAISLPFGLLTQDQAQQVLKNVQTHLYTPLGLRTLDQENPEFIPTYSGNSAQRDSAYHEGTVWPFLLGEYWIAKQKHDADLEQVKAEFLKDLAVMKYHFYNENALFCISEIFDGDDPQAHLGKGAIHQAWSVAAFIKVINDLNLQATC